MSIPDTRVFIAFDLAAGGVGDFFVLDDPAKGVLSGQRTNLTPNPSFEVNTTGWSPVSLTTITRVSTWSKFGTHSVRVRPTVNFVQSSYMLLNTDPFVPGRTYTISAYINTPVALVNAGPDARRIIAFVNLPASGFVEFKGNQGPVVGEGRVSLTFTVPDNAVSVSLQLWNGSTSDATNDVFFDGILIEEVSQVLPYFDGDVYDGDDGQNLAWTGTPHASTSTADVVNAFPLSGDILEEVTSDVRSVSVRRGRSRQLERFDAGGAVVDIRNDERKYDPAAGTAITPFGASMRPRKEVVIQSNGLPVFRGVVEDWDLEYDLNGGHIASVKATDQFAILAQQVLPPFTVSQQSSGDRVRAVLDRPSVAWPQSLREISAGKATLGTAVIEPDTNVLDYLQDVELSEPGALFISNNGQLVFRARDDFQFLPKETFADDGTGIRFTDISISFGTEELRNRVSVTLAGEGGTATAVNNLSVNAYGGIDFNLFDSLLSNLNQAQDLADYLVNVFGEPQLRIDSVQVSLGSPGDRIVVDGGGSIITQGLTPVQVNEVLAVDLGDLVRVKFTPSGIGDQIDQLCIVDAIEHDITPNEHVVRFNLSQTRTGFILDDANFGVLDVDRLGF
jgi:hypothetical protein